MRDRTIALLGILGFHISFNAMLMLFRIDYFGILWGNIFIIGAWIVGSAVFIGDLEGKKRELEEKEKRLTTRIPPSLPTQTVNLINRRKELEEGKHDITIIRPNGPHYGEYCYICGKWLGWIAKKQALFLIEKQKDFDIKYRNRSIRL